MGLEFESQRNHNINPLKQIKMKTIKSLKDITTLEVDDVVVFGDLKYEVAHISTSLNNYYYLDNFKGENYVIFEQLNINKRAFIEKLGINANCVGDFPETKSLEALTAIVSALFKEYEKQNELPKTWEEFCKRNPIKEEECLISPFCKIYITETIDADRNANEDKNYCISKQEAEAFLALMQLRQLRKAYIKNYGPNWMDKPDSKYAISVSSNKLSVCTLYNKSRNLSFPTYQLANQFLTNFKDLLEIAKPLL